MHDSAAAYLTAWQNFYIIVGSSAGGLTGLQFVVITLIAELRPQSTVGEISAFSTSTVVHFSAVLLLASILSAPWTALSNVAWGVGMCGVAGVAYAAIVAKRTARQEVYRASGEEWVWYVVLPFLSYAGILAAGVALQSSPASALFVVAAAALVLLFIGIHNAWDTVTYVAIRGGQPSPIPEIGPPRKD